MFHSSWYTSWYAVTTIKVDSVVRDRLQAVARARGITMGGLLRQVSDELAAAQEWADVESAYDRLRRDDPDGWNEYLGELDTLDAWSVDPGDAAAEWPEYQR